MTRPPAGEAARTGEDRDAISVLVVDDDPTTRVQLTAFLTGWGFAVRQADHGREAWETLTRLPIRIVISDWYMPEMDGAELCRRVRQQLTDRYVYFILITGQGGKEQYLTGMRAGADDFITKPVDPDELRARLTVAERILGLHRTLQRLEGLLPLCSYCKRIRDEAGHWNWLEDYIEQRSTAQFSHGICPECYLKEVKPLLDRGGPAR